MNRAIRRVTALAMAVLMVLTACSTSGDDRDDRSTDGHTATTVAATDVGDTEPVVADATFADRPCWDDVVATPPVTVRCGTLTVPERHGDPDGASVVLPVAILEPPEAPTADPVVYLDGGPGGDGVSAAWSFSEEPIARQGTVVIVGQRGTPFADPSFDCAEVEAADTALYDEALATPESNGSEDDALRACFERVTAEGVDLSTYDSATAADDLEAARRALGYDEWALYGISYGTRLALEVLRRHPEHITAVVLDSTYPTDVDAFAELEPNAARAFDELFGACEADPSCASAYPDLEARTVALFERYEASPVDTTATDPLTGEAVTVRWDGDRLMQAAFNALYLPDLIPLLPFLVASAENDDMSLATGAYLELIGGAAETLAEGLYPAIECRERYPFTDFDEVARQIEEEPAYLIAAAGAETDGRFCQVWEAPPADASVAEPVVTNVPMLVLAGRFDPVTPPRWGRQVADAQPDAYYVEFPDIGHAVSGDPCASEIIAAFVAAPDTAPDTSCIAETPPIEWVLP